VSQDAGQSFSLTPFELPRGARLRSVFGQTGHVWIVASTGLYRSTDAASTFSRVDGVDSALALGFGRAAEGAEYPAVYLSGKVEGEAGIFRSDDAGLSFLRISDERNQLGWVGFITGDQRTHGRVYLGTGGRGIFYGDPL
jgi:xyloglucan-specific exo-beta-1,4-glucanase